MSQLVRFKIDGVYTKARIYEQGSKKLDCVCCKQRKFGLLIRHIEPTKIPDTLICNECVVQIALGLPIPIDRKTKFGAYSKADIIANAPRRKADTVGVKKGKVIERTLECPYCDELFSPQGLPLHIKKHESNNDKPKEKVNASETVITDKTGTKEHKVSEGI